MGKFKVGQKVRVLEENNSVGDFKGLKVGTETTIEKAAYFAGGWVLNGARKPYFHTEDQFEAVDDDTWDFDPRKAGNDNTFKIEEGKFYRTRDGRKVGPIELHEPGAYGDGTGRLWKGHGTRYFGGETHTDLIAEWVDEPKLKVGDRVRWVRGSRHWQAVTLISRFNDGDWLGQDDTEGEGAFPEAELELLPAAAPAPEHTPHIVAVFINGHPAPNQRPFVHGNAEAATAEAERLASLHPSQEFGVFALVAKRVGEVTVRAA